jgi:hypothetical protein
MAARTPSRAVAAELAFLTRALKAPTLRESVPRLAERARTESWTHEEFLAACLQREVSAREFHGGVIVWPTAQELLDARWAGRGCDAGRDAALAGRCGVGRRRGPR